MIRLLLTDGALAAKCSGLAPEMFSAPFLGRIYQLLRDAWEDGRTLTAATIAAGCTPEEMGQVSAIMQQPVAAANMEKALEDYIQVIQRSAERRQDRDTDPLLAAVEKYKKADKQKKGNGGKQT